MQPINTSSVLTNFLQRKIKEKKPVTLVNFIDEHVMQIPGFDLLQPAELDGIQKNWKKVVMHFETKVEPRPMPLKIAEILTHLFDGDEVANLVDLCASKYFSGIVSDPFAIAKEIDYEFSNGDGKWNYPEGCVVTVISKQLIEGREDEEYCYFVIKSSIWSPEKLKFQNPDTHAFHDEPQSVVNSYIIHQNLFKADLNNPDNFLFLELEKNLNTSDLGVYTIKDFPVRRGIKPQHELNYIPEENEDKNLFEKLLFDDPSKFFALLENENSTLVEQLSFLLLNLAGNIKKRLHLLNNGGFDAVLSLFKHKNENILSLACRLLDQLSVMDSSTNGNLNQTRLKCLDEVINFLNHENPQFVVWACCHLGEVNTNNLEKYRDHSGEKSISHLIKLLESNNEQIVQAALWCLYKMTWSHPNQLLIINNLNPLITLLTHNSDNIQELALYLAGNLFSVDESIDSEATKLVIEKLISILNHKNSSIVKLSCNCLRTITSENKKHKEEYKQLIYDKGGIESLLSLVKLNNEVAKEALISICSFFEDEDYSKWLDVGIVSILFNCLNENANTSKEIFWMLGKIFLKPGGLIDLGKTEALNSLVELVNHQNDEIASDAVWFFNSVCNHKSFDLDEQKQKEKIIIINQLLKSPNDAKQILGLRFLGASLIETSPFSKENREFINQTDVIPTLIQFLNCESPSIHEPAVWCLASLSSLENNKIIKENGGVDKLIDLLTSQSDMAIRGAAFCLFNLFNELENEQDQKILKNLLPLLNKSEHELIRSCWGSISKLDFQQFLSWLENNESSKKKWIKAKANFHFLEFLEANPPKNFKDWLPHNQLLAHLSKNKDEFIKKTIHSLTEMGDKVSQEDLIRNLKVISFAYEDPLNIPQFPLELKAPGSSNIPEKPHNISIKIGGQIISCHKEILTKCSDFFAAMLSTNMREITQPEIELKEISFEIFTKLVGFMNSKKCTVDSIDDVVEILKEAERFQILELQELCIEFLPKNVSEESFHGIISASNSFKLTSNLINWLCHHYNKLPNLHPFVSENWEFILSHLIKQDD